MWTRWSEIDRMFNAMDSLQSKMDRLFPDYGRFRSMPAAWQVSQVGPSSNLYDVGDHLEMVLEVPGMGKEDINIKLQGNYLEISGNRKSDSPENYTVHRIERGISSFTRSFTLPSEVDANKVEASLKNGLLKLVLPKSEAAKPKQISIN